MMAMVMAAGGCVSSMPVLGLPCLHGVGRLHIHDHDVNRKRDVEHVAELPLQENGNTVSPAG